MNPSKVFLASLQLIRPHNCLIASVSVVVGSILSRGSMDSTALSAIVMTFVIAGGGYAINDLLDFESDRLVKPRRPLARGLPPRIALIMALILWAFGLGIALFTSQLLLIFCLIWLVCLLSYSLWLKGAGIVGHIIIAVIGGSGLLLGGLLGDDVNATYIPFAITAIFHFTREAIKSIADYEGDRVASIGTSAVRFGLAKARDFAILSGILLIVLSLVPAILGSFGLAYLVIVIFGVYPFVGLALLDLRQAATTDQLYHSANRGALLLKIAMPVGLAAFVVGGY